MNFKEVNEDNKREVFGEIYSSIDTLAFTFGNVWVRLDRYCGVSHSGQEETSTMCGDLTLSQQWKCLCLFGLISLRVLFFLLFVLSVPVCDSAGDSETRCRCLFMRGSDFFIPVSLPSLRVSDFLMGDVENGSSLRLTQTRRSRVSHPHGDLTGYHQISPGGGVQEGYRA